MTLVKKNNNFKAKWGTLVYGEDCDNFYPVKVDFSCF
jgi:hypothetical protein